MEDRGGEKGPTCKHGEKTKIMESCINLDVLKKSGKHTCGVCQTGVALMQSSAASAGCIRKAVALRDQALAS